MYRIELESHARKQFLDLPKRTREDLVPVLDSLAKNPRPSNSKKLKGVDGYRIRKGDYRILYTVSDREKRIRIYRIAHRKEVYR